MRHFVAESIHHLRGQTVGGIPLFEAQMITRLFLNSDNAAQHFKSSKSLHCPSHSPLNVKKMISWRSLIRKLSEEGPCRAQEDITETKPKSHLLR